MDTQAKGSFGIPPEMREAIEKSKSQSQEEPTQEATQEDDKTEAHTPEDSTEKSDDSPENPDINAEEETVPAQPTDEEIVREVEKLLEVKLSEDDVWSLDTGILTKENICVVPGRLYVTFRTLSMNESREVDRAIKAAVDEGLLDTGVMNVKARITLKYGLLAIGKKGDPRSLGNSSEERDTALGELNTLVVEKCISTWNRYGVLLNYAMAGGDQIKKS